MRIPILVKTLSAFAILGCAYPAQAFICKTPSMPNWLFLNSGGTIDLLVDIVPGSDGNSVTYGPIELSCRYGEDLPISSRRCSNNSDNDMYVDPNGLTIPLVNSVSGLTGGLLLNGTKIPIPIPSTTKILSAPCYASVGGSVSGGATTGPAVTPNMTFYIERSARPVSLQVNNGDIIGTFRTTTYNVIGGALLSPAPMTLNLIARSSITLWPNTCTINGGASLDVDFGNVVDSKISTVPTNPGSYSVTKNLSYSCSDKTVTQGIGITLQAPQTASFDNRLIGTSNSGLGVSLVKGSSVVGVNGRYTAQMVNGDGTDAITFNLVRNPSALPAAGGFAGTAVLQIGLP
ncbi:fimbrial protein (plasmid) [Serratia sp. JSRIV001]|uniref:fimbrial protein n=1 Tax=unclassified Serratia (in: enterobacteria) TaxID=2647522 RepID=UPI001CBBB496|nr:MULTISPECIES: fimbrial protein [unclassified Serratia (in: enterobacteria)]UAN48826.1 fimbrial protein [Serratia sp. JSRIV001]UAN50684.1 fimbrial protein [Serratia sp. JSRIV002]UAN56641.1 fimbrial protein [Serratia sp. JSRIV004]